MKYFSLPIVLALSTVCFATATSVSDFEYKIVDNEVTIITYLGTDEEVVVPDKIEECPVTALGDYSFSTNGVLRSVVLPGDLLTLGARCFYQCTNLVNIEIPEKVTTIGRYAFGGCIRLQTINIPAGVEEIGERAFVNSSATIQVDEDNASYCSEGGVLFDKDKSTLIFYPPFSSAPQYVIPGGVSRIEAFAFSFCSNLKTVVFPKNMAGIQNSAFYLCSGLEYINLHENIETIGAFAFSDCIRLTNVVMSNVIKIEDLAFNKCAALEQIDLGDRLEEIGGGSFLECSSLKELSFPMTFKCFGPTFIDCTSLEHIYFKGNTPTTPFVSSTQVSDVFAVPYPTIHYLEGTRGWKGEYKVNEEGDQFDPQETSNLLRFSNWWLEGVNVQTWTLPADKPEIFIPQKTVKDGKVEMTLVFGGALQSSTNLKDWETIETASPYLVSGPTADKKFYRAVSSE